MKNNSLTIEHKILLVMSLLILVAVVMWFLLLTLVFNQARLVGQHELDLKVYDTRQFSVASLRSIVTKTEMEQARLANYFYHEDSMVKLVESIEALASEAKLPIDFADLKIEKNNLVVSLNFEGSWLAVNNFLAKLPHGPYISQIQSIDLRERVVETEAGAKQISWLGQVELLILSFEAN